LKILAGSDADPAEHAFVRVTIKKRIRIVKPIRLCRPPQALQPLLLDPEVSGNSLEFALIVLPADEAVPIMVCDEQFHRNTPEFIDIWALRFDDQTLFNWSPAGNHQSLFLDLNHA
jgi:hypothetical protein